MGQGHLTTLPRVIAKKLGVDVSQVKLVEGDSDLVPDGTPSVASRSLMMAGSAMAIACDNAIEKGRRVAGHLFEAAADDVEFANGRFRVRGTDLSMPVLELAVKAKTAPGLPEELQGGLDNVAEFISPQMSFPNGCHVCEVEIDPQSGVVEVVGYWAVDDVGNIVDETIVDGQLHGGVAQGLGQVLGEHVVYGADGQLVNASFMDYGASQRSLHDQSARREGRRRIRRRRRAAGRHERGAGCAWHARDRAFRSARLARAGVAGAGECTMN
jgi:carbon-monoxide dehydrogenase large subunit